MGTPKLLLDENIGVITADALRRQNWDVSAIAETDPGITDRQVMEKALAEGRILVTLDRDFGYLVHKESRKHAGVVYLRLQKETPGNIIAVLQKFEEHLSGLGGKFARLAEHRIVIR